MADVDPQIVRVETNRKKENDGLSMMIRQPPGIVGELAFNHQVQFFREHMPTKKFSTRSAITLCALLVNTTIKS